MSVARYVAHQDGESQQGEAVNLSFDLSAAGSLATALSGRWVLQRKQGDLTPLLDFPDIAIDVSAKIVGPIFILRSHTKDLPASTYWHQLDLVDADGEFVLSLEGNWELTSAPGVFRS
jgi:hypothetical protein